MATTSQPWATRGPKDREGARRQREILDAARTVFESKGFEAATISDIADAAGVSRPTFYVYYASKAEAFRALAEQIMDRFRAAQRLPGGESTPVAEVIRATMIATFDQTVDHLRILSVLDHQALMDPQIGEMWSPLRQRAIDRTAAYLRHQVEFGRTSPGPDPEVLALTGRGMLDLFAPLVVSGVETREGAIERMYQVWVALLGLSESAWPSAGSEGAPRRGH